MQQHMALLVVKIGSFTVLAIIPMQVRIEGSVDITFLQEISADVGRNKPVRAPARTGVSGAPIAGNTHPCYHRAGLFRPTSEPFRHSYQMTVLNRLVYNDKRCEKMRYAAPRVELIHAVRQTG
jgi:hypothetical protein